MVKLHGGESITFRLGTETVEVSGGVHRLWEVRPLVCGFMVLVIILAICIQED